MNALATRLEDSERIDHVGSADPSRAFWDARASLRHVRQFAYSRRVSPWSLLAVAIAYRLAELPPNYVLPPLVGSHGSLNFYAGLVADSGGGKSAAMGAGRELVASTVYSPEPGSGEALAHLFVSRSKTGDIEWQRRSVLARWDEISTLKGTANRTGATLLSKLCTAFVGGEIGSSHVDRQKSLPLGEHTYRLCVVAGVQPSLSHIILNESAGGLPQRFLWLPATDPWMPTVRPDDPGCLPLADLSVDAANPVALSDRVVVPVTEAVERAIDAEQLRRVREGAVDPLDAHAHFVRLKVAIGLDLLQPGVTHPKVTDEGWRLAGQVMAQSDRTRASMTERLRHDRLSLANDAGEIDGVRSAAKTTSAHAIIRTRNWVREKLAGEELTPGALRKKARSTDRGNVDLVVERMIGSGEAIVLAGGVLSLPDGWTPPAVMTTPRSVADIDWDSI